MLEKTERAIKNEQSRDTGNIWLTKTEDKQDRGQARQRTNKTEDKDNQKTKT